MMTAREARQFMNTYRKNYIGGQLKSINSKISMAIQDGYDHVCLDMAIDKDIENTMKNLGYEIEMGLVHNNPYTIIKW